LLKNKKLSVCYAENAEKINAQQNYAGSGEIQEEHVDVNGQNVFRAYAPREVQAYRGSKNE